MGGFWRVGRLGGAGSGYEAEHGLGGGAFGEDGFGQGRGVGVEELEGEAFDDASEVGGGGEVSHLLSILAS